MLSGSRLGKREEKKKDKAMQAIAMSVNAIGSLQHIIQPINQVK